MKLTKALTRYDEFTSELLALHNSNKITIKLKYNKIYLPWFGSSACMHEFGSIEELLSYIHGTSFDMGWWL